MAFDKDTLAAIRKYGPQINDYAESQYQISGEALLAKLTQGESGGKADAVSNVGARGRTQFMPGSRQIAMDKYGVDPWRSADEAIHAAVLHLQGKINGSKGLAGYNPGMPTYTSYILGQKVGDVRGNAPRPSASPSTTSPADGAGSVAVPSAPSHAGFSDPGQAGNVSALLASLVAKPQQGPPSSSIAPPQFSGAQAMPQGFRQLTPDPVQQTQGQDGVAGALSLLESLRGTDPSGGGVEAPAAPAPPGIAEVVHDERGKSKTLANGGAQSALAWAESKVGLESSRETGGENRGKLADYANSRFGMSAQPWCAMFTSLAVTKGGAPKTARTASVREVRQKALVGEGYKKGLINPRAAKPGDLVLFGDRHIGMVKSVDGDKIQYVGGNQSDSVTIATTSVNGVDVVRPQYGQRFQ